MNRSVLLKVAPVVLLVGVFAAGTGLVAHRVLTLAGEKQRAALPAAGAFRVGDELPNLSVQREDGTSVSFKDFMGEKRFLVVNFHHPDCPCAANCGKLIGELMTEGVTDVAVLGILSIGEKDARVREALAAQLASGEVPFPVLFDEGRAVQQKLGATRTPELWIVDRDLRIHYWGAPESSLFPGTQGHRYYLREALAALRAGRSPEVVSAPPIGCLIDG
jgi:peroxiredoxin